MMNSRFRSEETLPLIPCTRRDDLYDTFPSGSTKKVDYPKGVYFVLTSKFFEAFAANGIRTILALYLRDNLLFSESFSTIMLHVFNFFSQFCPIFGAVLADSYLGNVKTISGFLVLYAFGWIGIFITAFPINGFSIMWLVSLALLFTSIGNGSIRACVTSLGAKQFSIPEQNKYLENYFSHYYFVYYIGIFLSKIIPPFVRSQTSCFNKTDCYPAVFGVLGLLFFIAWIIFFIGKWFYTTETIAEENILMKFFGCIKYAFIAKLTDRHKTETNWLNYSIDKYSSSFVSDVKTFLQVSKLFLPLPIYWSLLAQQDSNWTFQAAQMNTSFFGLTIQPDQAKAMGPIFLFLMIPIWQHIIYPSLNRCNIYIHPLHSVAIGGICSALAFVCSGLLQQQIEVALLKSVNIAWQIPQFLLLFLGELFLSIPGLQFAFTEAPPIMKSVLTAAWFLNSAIGNLIVIVVTKLKPCDLQSTEYFTYSILMFTSVIIFTILASNYIKESNNSKLNVDINCK